MCKQNGIEAKRMELNRKETKRVETYEVIVVIDDERERTRENKREDERMFRKVLAHRGLGYAHESKIR
jgi:hypothetical protein